MKNFRNSKQLDEMLRAVSAKVGISAEKLRRELEEGRFDNAISGLQPQDRAKLQQVLSNPAKLDQIINSSQAKALYEKLTKSN